MMTNKEIMADIFRLWDEMEKAFVKARIEISSNASYTISEAESRGGIDSKSVNRILDEASEYDTTLEKIKKYFKVWITDLKELHEKGEKR